MCCNIHLIIWNACPGCKSLSSLTQLLRDIPTGVMTKAPQVMNELNLVEDFPVDNITNKSKGNTSKGDGLYYDNHGQQFDIKIL